MTETKLMAVAGIRTTTAIPAVKESGSPQGIGHASTPDSKMAFGLAAGGGGTPDREPDARILRLPADEDLAVGRRARDPYAQGWLHDHRVQPRCDFSVASCSRR
jgi:hypothetical protein